MDTARVKITTPALRIIALVIVLACPLSSQASIQAFELLVDAGAVGDIFAEITGYPTDGLTRARGYLNPFSVTVETNDANIQPAIHNGVANMGNFTSEDTSYTHRLDWLAPPANGSYLDATLYIAAVGLNNPTEVLVEGYSLGPLDGIISTYSGIDVTLLGDDLLNVVIDKGTFQFFGEHPNNLVAILGSKLVVSYQPSSGDAVVPETSSLVAWAGLTCIGFVFAKRRFGM